MYLEYLLQMKEIHIVLQNDGFDVFFIKSLYMIWSIRSVHLW